MNEVNQMKWARYLLTFDHDHFDVVGFNPTISPKHVAFICTDNMRLSELKGKDPLGAFDPFDLPASEPHVKTQKTRKRIELKKLPLSA